jgi:alkanesulfonate monooxygenase SsuD/methylene tetrahydromethanopterin reductase-like flavin-dependent oxidoreductase (luciferase family)
LGGGTKRQNIQQLGREFDHPASRLRELIVLLRTSWSTPNGQPVEFHGRFYDVAGTGARDSRASRRLPHRRSTWLP